MRSGNCEHKNGNKGFIFVYILGESRNKFISGSAGWVCLAVSGPGRVFFCGFRYRPGAAGLISALVFGHCGRNAKSSSFYYPNYPNVFLATILNHYYPSAILPSHSIHKKYFATILKTENFS